MATESVYIKDFDEEEEKPKQVKLIGYKDSFIFITLSSLLFFLLFFLMQSLKELFFGLENGVDRLGSSSTFLFSTLLTSIIFGIFDLFVILLLPTVINVVLARFFNLQTGRVFWLSLLTSLFALISYIVYIFVLFTFYDPLNIVNKSWLEIIFGGLPQFQEQLESVDFNKGIYGLLQLIYFIGFLFFYKEMYITNPTIVNFAILVILGFSSSAFDQFSYAYIYVFIIYFIIINILFPHFVDSCSCIPPYYMDIYGLPTDIGNSILGDYDLTEMVKRKREFEEKGI